MDLEQVWGQDSFRKRLEDNRSCANYQEETQPQVIGFSARLAGLTMDLAIAQLLGKILDQGTVTTYLLHAVGQSFQQDRVSFQVTRCSAHVPASKAICPSFRISLFMLSLLIPLTLRRSFTSCFAGPFKRTNSSPAITLRWTLKASRS